MQILIRGLSDINVLLDADPVSFCLLRLGVGIP